MATMSSKLDLLGDRERIIDFNAKVSHGAFQLRMAKQELDRAQVAGLLLNLCRLGPAHGMGAVGGGIKPDLLDPIIDDPCILASGQVWTFAMAAREKVAAVNVASIYPALHRAPCRFGDLELHWPPGFALDDDGTIANSSAEADILDLDGDKIAGTQFAVDRQIEQGKIPRLGRHFKSDPDGPDLFRLQGTLLAFHMAIWIRTASFCFDLYRHGRISYRPRLLSIRLRSSLPSYRKSCISKMDCSRRV
jgi:hypothetical protein